MSAGTAREVVRRRRADYVKAKTRADRARIVDGRAVVRKSVHWGEGLEVTGERESRVQPLYIGNNDQGSAGVTGGIDPVRVHRNVPERIEWGMRAVHELQRGGPQEKLLTGFGYGTCASLPCRARGG